MYAQSRAGLQRCARMSFAASCGVLSRHQREARVFSAKRIGAEFWRSFRTGGCAIMKFRFALLGIAAGAALALDTTGASADGPAYRRSISDGPYAPSFSWTGFYVGVHAGHAWADVDWDLTYFDSPHSGSTNNDGSIYGAQIGYLRQSGRWVFGGEVAFSGGFDDGANIVPLAGLPVGVVETDIDWLLTVTARLGYSWDRWLAYVKGGYAAARISVHTDDNIPFDFVSSTTDVHHGWTVGAGLEYAVSPNVTFGVEYNYVDLGGDVSAPIITTFDGSALGTARSDVDTSIHTVMARLNFKFGRDEVMPRPMK